MTSSLRAYLLAYDIRDPKRLQRLHHFLSAEALAVQYSVFAGAWSEKALLRIQQQVRLKIDSSEDDVRIYPIPDRCNATVLGPGQPEGVVLQPAGLGLFRALRSGAAVELAAMVERKRQINTPPDVI